MQAYIPISIMVARMIYTLANKISTQKNTQIMVAITTVALLPMIIWVYKNHPNQIVFYNIISGGTKAVEKRQLVDYADYWGNGYLQGIKWLNNNAKERAIIIADEGQHIVTFQHNLLRRDLQLLPLNLSTITRLRQFPQETTVYYMTLNRTHNTQLLLLNESSLTYEVKVDELPILYIHQTDAKHMAIEVEKRYLNP